MLLIHMTYHRDHDRSHHRGHGRNHHHGRRRARSRRRAHRGHRGRIHLKLKFIKISFNPLSLLKIKGQNDALDDVYLFCFKAKHVAQ